MKAPVLTNKGKAIVITLSVLVLICAILLFAAWAYGYTHNMTFGDVMQKCFDSEKYNLNTEVKNLTKVKLGYESTIKDYTENIETQRETIIMLQEEVERNESEIRKLKVNESENYQKILVLENQNASLQRVINSLNDSNTITSSAVAAMTKQLGEINSLLQQYIAKDKENRAEIEKLKEQNASLEKQLGLYKRMVESLVEENTSIVTFMYNGNVYDVQLVQNGEKVTVVTPSNSEYFVFNGWLQNGVSVDLTQITISGDTVFVADLKPLVKINVTVNNQSTRTNVEAYYFDSFKSADNWTYDPSKIVVTNGVCVASDGDKVIGYDNNYYYNGVKKARQYFFTAGKATSSDGVVKTAGVSTYKYGYIALNIQDKDIRPTLSVKVNVNGVTYDMSEFLSSQSWNFELDYLFDVSSLIQDGVKEYNVSFIIADVNA